VALSQRTTAALQQQPGHPVSLAELVLILFAIQNGFVDDVDVTEVPTAVADMWEYVHRTAGSAMEEIAESKILTASASKRIADALVGFNGVKKQRQQQQQEAVTAAQ
jgi:F-type H+-transporting ATPase subunit alpha